MSSNFPACYLARYSVLLASFLYLATPTLHPAHGPAHALQPLRPRRLAPARSLCLRILLPSLYCASRSRPLSRRRCSSALLRQPLQAAHLALTSPECRSVLVFFFFASFVFDSGGGRAASRSGRRRQQHQQGHANVSFLGPSAGWEATRSSISSLG